MDVSVSNPSPGGGTSNTLPFNVKTSGLSILTEQLPDAYNSKPYSYELQAEGGISPYLWFIAAGSLPNGLTLNPSGEISGTAPNVATDTSYPFTVDLIDAVPPPDPLNMISHDFSMTVKSGSPGRNDSCIAAMATPISNGILRASISPYGDIDVYSFHGTSGNTVTVELFAQRLDLDDDPTGQDIYMDTFLEILDDGCDPIAYNDDIDLGVVYDSMISGYTLPYTGIYHIRVSDLRGDGRPDFLYDISLSGAD
ncbi:MAG: putative Ig domain-containing protein [Acidobacteria bacterium]|nr:putative Ig domain-containing protein [Acidobacteriota bacterium]